MMKWKEFFKPTIAKLVIFLMILLLLPVSGGEVCESRIDKSGGCYPFILLTYEVFTGGIAYYTLFSTDIFYINIIIAYLISCLIVWIFNKVRKKR